MKTLITILISLIISLGLVSLNSSLTSPVAEQSYVKADGPGTGNDGEDTSERGMVCRLFGVFC